MIDSPLLFVLLAALCIGSALTTLISFILYLKARTAGRAHPDELNSDHLRRHKQLDRKERMYQSIHFISLAIFVFLGVLVLILISRRID